MIRLPVLPGPVLCPQEYDDPGDMRVTPCTRCSTGWDPVKKRCTAETGAEDFPLTARIPECPIASRCQHHLQEAPTGVCVVRARGMVCESALTFVGVTEEEHMARRDVFSASYDLEVVRSLLVDQEGSTTPKPDLPI